MLWKYKDHFLHFSHFEINLKNIFHLRVWDKGVIVLMGADRDVSVLFSTWHKVKEIQGLTLHFTFYNVLFLKSIYYSKSQSQVQRKVWQLFFSEGQICEWNVHILHPISYRTNKSNAWCLQYKMNLGFQLTIKYVKIQKSKNIESTLCIRSSICIYWTVCHTIN